MTGFAYAALNEKMSKNLDVALHKCYSVFLREQSSTGKEWTNRANKSFVSLVVILFKSYKTSIFSIWNAVVKENGFPEFSVID